MFLRDVSQWSQLLLLLALMLVYLYNFRVLDLDRIPYMSGVVKNVYAFVESRHGRSGDGDRRRPLRLSRRVGRRRGVLDRPDRADLAARLSLVEVLDGLVPVLVLTEALTIAANYLLGVDPFLQVSRRWRSCS